jgi:hypothetical protein
MTCLNTCGSIGSYFKMAVKDSDTATCEPVTFDDTAERYEILDEDVQYTDLTLGGNGLTGGIDPIINHLRSGTRIVYGDIIMEVGPYQLEKWLPRILGNAPSGNTYTTNEEFDLRPFDILMKRDQGTLHYRNCVVDKALFRGRATIDGDEQIMQMHLSIIGFEEHSETEWPDPEPPLPSGNQLYWLIGDGKLTLPTGTAEAQEEYYFDAFNILFNNNLLPLTRNFLSITCLRSMGRQIRMNISTPYTIESHAKLYVDKVERAQGVLSFLGTKNLVGTDEEPYTTIFTFPNLYQTRRTPATRGHGEIPLALDFQAYRDGTTEPVSIENSYS